MFHCVFINVYRIDWCIDLFSGTAARVFNKLTYLLTHTTARNLGTQLHPLPEIPAPPLSMPRWTIALDHPVREVNLVWSIPQTSRRTLPVGNYPTRLLANAKLTCQPRSSHFAWRDTTRQCDSVVRRRFLQCAMCITCISAHAKFPAHTKMHVVHSFVIGGQE